MLNKNAFQNLYIINNDLSTFYQIFFWIDICIYVLLSKDEPNSTPSVIIPAVRTAQFPSTVKFAISEPIFTINSVNEKYTIAKTISITDATRETISNFNPETMSDIK